MTDYNLSSLSTRSFEQLIQALATQVIGPGMIIFGDGPDGGREATFEGSMSYPAKDNGWNGYVVVQAKFKQRLQDSKKDGEWALEQLRQELAAFADRKTNRRLPEYYIFATNVVLTPVSKRGAKDKVLKVFGQYKKDIPLKDYAIWDYDQIRTFLDNAEAIRHSYAAWITPGDVLSQMIEWLKPEKKDFEQILSNFLQKELQMDQYVNLEQAGHAVEDKIPIARVFIDAPALDHSTLEPPDEEPNQLPPGFVSDLLQTATERLDQDSQSKPVLSRNQRQRVGRSERGRLVLIGGPGQGKTTFSQFICQLFRASILKSKDSGLAPETQQALAVIEGQCRKESIYLPTARRFPVRIVLSEFAAALARKETNSLLSYIVHRVNKRTDQNVSPDDLRKWLGAYPWLLILDGLDEVPASSNREEVLTAVRDFWVDASECNADILVVATTRPQGYSQEFSAELYQHYWLAPLSIARALHYAHRLVEARYSTDEDRREKILNRLTSASSNEATARLMRSPLQVTIMAALVDKVGKPPQERWTLFRDYYKVIYDREVERDIPAAEILRDYKPDVDTIHYRVGLLLQIEGESSGSTDARLSRGRLTEIIRDRLVEEEHTDSEVEELQDKITKAAAERLVFLAGLESDRVGFEIRSFQEFMAAESLMEGDDKSIRERLREIGSIAYWRNAFLFAAGKCFAERQHLRDVILALCDEMNEDPEDDALRVTLAGSQLALDLLEDGPARRQPKYAHALARNALRLLDLQPSDYHKRLAELNDPTLADVYRKEIENRLSSRNFKQRLGAWTCLSYLIELRVKWAEDMAKTQWPEQREDRLDLLKVALRTGITSKLFSMLVKSLPLFSLNELRDLYFVVESNRRRPDHEGGTSTELTKIDKSLPVMIELLDSANYGGGHGSNDAFLRFQNSPESPMSFGYFPIDPGSYRWVSVKDLLRSYHPAWAPYIAAARFLEDPCKRSLATQLRFVARFATDELSTVFGVPWPLGAFYKEAKSQSELLAFAHRAESGLFGDSEDWQKAERRWQEAGIVADDFSYATEEHWPFDARIGSNGFPFNVSWYKLHDYDSGIVIEPNLSQLYQGLKNSPVRPLLANALLFLFRSIGRRTRRKVDLEYLKDLLEQSQKTTRWLDDEFLTFLDDTTLMSEDGMAFMDQLGAKFRWYSHSSKDDRIPSIIARAFYSRPSLTGLLRIFSYLSGNPRLIPTHLVDPEIYSEPSIKEAAIVVRLGQKNVNSNEQVSLARTASELVHQQISSPRSEAAPRSEIVERTLEVVARTYETGDISIEPFLLRLYKELPSDTVREERVVETLTRVLRLRLSGLRKPQVWLRLNLPTGLGNILQNDQGL